MKIYFAGSIRAGRSRQPIYAAIVKHLEDTGHTVLTEHVASETVGQNESNQSDEQIYAQDVAWLDECDAVVAEVTTPSLGVGYEIAYALHHLETPVLGLCQRGTRLSAMLRGNTAPGFRLAWYGDLTDALAAIDRFLQPNGDAGAPGVNSG